MKKTNIPAIVTAFVAVCLVAIVAVIGVKARNSAKVIEAIPSDYGTENSLDIGTITPEDTTEYTGELISDFSIDYSTTVTLPTVTQPVVTLPSSTTAPSTTAPATTKEPETIKVDAGENTTVVAVIDNVTVPVQDEDELSHGKAPSVGVTVSEAELPADMYFAGLHKLGYSVIGPKNFIYNDDTAPDCAQRKFGYNVLYDAGAKLIDFSIETTRVKFNYDNKQYMIQMWKGQYISGDIGTVGGEVGIYTRALGSTSAIGHYNCADESDWLNMEMTVLWDEYGDGVYRPQFTRKYAKHWWETGYVDGQLKNKKDSSPLRILQRITFKDETQATLFEKALNSNGFRSVGTFNPTVKDTCKRFGNHVIYVWQDVR